MSKSTLSAFAAFAAVALLLGGCAGSAKPAEPPVSAEPTETAQSVEAPEEAPSDTTFVDGVLTTPEIIIKITDVRTIAVGEPGNEYGSVPVIAFWFDLTNVSAERATSFDWIYNFSAYQDNDPNVVNELNIGSAPDSALVATQSAEIKIGGTVQGAVAYELSDTTTPVELVAGGLFGDEPVGSMTYNLE